MNITTFTSMDLIDGKFVATIYDSTNNQEIYKTKPHKTQLQATQDITAFLTSTTNNKQTVVNNTTTFKKPLTTPSIPQQKRCCGR